jgi:hypothetical protein
VVATAKLERMVAFTYLRLGPDLLQPENWSRFAAFVKQMSQPGSSPHHKTTEDDELSLQPTGLTA